MSGNADRLLERQTHSVIRHRVHVSENLGGKSTVVFKAGGDVGDVVFGFDNGFAGVARFEFGQHREVLANFFCKAEEYAATLLRRRRCPRSFFERCLCRRDGLVYIVRTGFRNLRDYLFRGRIIDRKRLPRVAVNPFTVHVHLVDAHIRLHSTCHHSLQNSARYYSAKLALSFAADALLRP